MAGNALAGGWLYLGVAGDNCLGGCSHAGSAMASERSTAKCPSKAPGLGRAAKL